jgi:hypothetical protein
VRCFVGRITRPLFLTRDSPSSLPDGSSCWIRMITMRVLRLRASHLLLIRTKSGYGTVPTVACASQGCSDRDFYYYYFQFTDIVLATIKNPRWSERRTSTLEVERGKFTPVHSARTVGLTDWIPSTAQFIPVVSYHSLKTDSLWLLYVQQLKC